MKQMWESLDGSFVGHCMASFWALYGFFLGSLWLLFGPFMASFWALYGFFFGPLMASFYMETVANNVPYIFGDG